MRPMTEKTEKRIAQTTVALLNARGGFDHDALMRFIDVFYDCLADRSWGLVEPIPVTEEWIRSVAEMLADGFVTWLRDVSH